MSRSVFNHRRTAPVLSRDSFNRANNQSLTNTDGDGLLDPRTWTEGYAGIDVFGLGIGSSGTRVVNNGNDIATPHAYHTAFVDLFTPDVELSIDVVAQGGGKSAGLLVRYLNDNNFWAVQWAGDVGSGPMVKIYKTVAGTESLVTSSASLGGVTGTLRVVAAGSAINAYVLNTLVASATDSFNSTATKHGLAIRNDPAGTLNGSSLDNWQAVRP